MKYVQGHHYVYHYFLQSRVRIFIVSKLLPSVENWGHLADKNIPIPVTTTLLEAGTLHQNKMPPSQHIFLKHLAK